MAWSLQEGVAPEDVHNPASPHLALTSLLAVQQTSIAQCPVAPTPDDVSCVFTLLTDTVSAQFGLFDCLGPEFYDGLGKSCKFEVRSSL